MKSSRLILLFIGYSLLLMALSGCGQKAKQALEQGATYPVSVTTVVQQDLPEFMFYTGDIEAKEEAVIYSKVNGKLVENKVEEDEVVKKGGTLALVDRDEIGYQFELAPVVSPIDGIVGRAYLDKGANVTPTTPVALVVNIDEVQVKINITEKDLPKLRKGQTAEVEVDAYPSELFTGQLLRVSPVVDLDTRTALAWVGIANSEHKLKPGMFARIKLLVGEHPGVLTIIREAVISEDSQRYAFVVEGNRASKRKIELGLASDERYEVRQGLTAGEKVIVLASPDLQDGTAIKIVEELN